MRNIFTFISILIYVSYSNAQNNTFTYEDFIDIVKKHHPISYQSNLQVEKGEAILLNAKGGFDPKIKANINQKQFKDTRYYSHINTKLNIPTWYGISAFAGYENNNGTYLNSELNTPLDGLFNAGLSITLGNGLFIDKRRAELKQAKIHLNSSKIEQKIIQNQLLYNASLTYWEWLVSYQKTKIYKDALFNAKQRFNGIKQSVKAGDKKAIDTIEAKIVIQTRLLNYEQSKLELNNKKLQLNIYLWHKGFVPLEIDSLATPGLNDINIIEYINTSESEKIINNHPEIILYKNKIEVQQIKNKLNKEALKPSLNINYNILSESVNSNNLNELSLNNYKWGMSFSYPIFIRKERANVRLSQIKLKETIANTELKKAGLRYKIDKSKNSILSFSNQLSIANESVKNYNTLYKAENTLFDIGESSVFMVNSREKSLINSKLKTVEINFKLLFYKQKYKYLLFIE